MPECRIRMGGRPGASESSVSAGHAAATGAAAATVASIATRAGLASATGATFASSLKVRPAAGLAAATGIGRNASTSSSIFTIQGYGKDALVGLGAGSYVVSSTATGTGAGTIGGALAWINASNKGTVSFSISGSFPLTNAVNYITSESNFLIDGRGQSITFTGGPLWFRDSHHFAVINVAHRGGWAGGQSGDCWTINDDCHDLALANCSGSDFSDEAFGVSHHCYNVTLQDCIWGPGQDVAHSYGGGIGCYSYNVSLIRNAFIGLEYRNPRVGYWNSVPSTCINGSDYDGGTPPVGVVVDAVNTVRVNCTWGGAIYSRGLINDTNPYNFNTPASGGGGDLWDMSTGSQASDLNGHTVDSWAQVSPLSATAAKEYVRTYGGRLPHDATDTALVAQIP